MKWKIGGSKAEWKNFWWIKSEKNDLENVLETFLVKSAWKNPQLKKEANEIFTQ